MAEIDLIPADYRAQIHHRQTIRRFTLIFIVLVAGITVGRLWLGHVINKEKAAIAQLKNGEVVVLDQRKLFEDLTAQRSALVSRLQALNILRGGPPAEHMFVVIDRAIYPSVWFLDWKFRRSGAVEERQPPDQSPGYFLVVPSGGKSSAVASWRNYTHMEIKGEAISHSALAEFVSRLLRRPEIKDVHVLNTDSRRYAAGQVVAYSLAVVVDSRGGRS